MVKNPPAMQESLGLGKSLGGGNGNPLQYSCLENPMDRGAWWARVHGVAKSGHNRVTKPPHQHHGGFLLSYGRREGCPSPTQAQCIQLSTRLLMGTYGVQSTKLDALRVSVDEMVSALVRESTHPLTGQRSDTHKPYIVPPSATRGQENSTARIIAE